MLRPELLCLVGGPLCLELALFEEDSLFLEKGLLEELVSSDFVLGH